MSIKRYSATKDATITNAYKDNLKTRAEKSNMGASDSLEIFSLYGRTSEEELEKSRILIYFPTTQIIEDRQNKEIAASGSTQFILKLSNVAHRESVPSKFTISVNAVSSSWEEGIGLDMESYKDEDAVNWISSSYGQKWVSEGGDYYNTPRIDKYFENGTEDLEVDVTDIVEQWISGTLPNHGFLLRLSSSLEEGQDNFYTKKFSARSSEYFFKRPWIEARSNSSIKDDRAKFYRYNQFVPIENNYNTIYLYNRFKGDLIDIPAFGTGSVYVALYSSLSTPLPTPLNQITGSTESPTSIIYATGSHVSTGIYKCDICINTSLEKIYDVWYNEDRTFLAGGGSITPLSSDSEATSVEEEYIFTVTNLKSEYSTKDNSTIKVFTRTKSWNPNSYTSVAEQDNLNLPDEIYYKIFRVVDNYDVIPYGTGSMKHTRLSRDKDANYFNLDFSMLEIGYAYGIKFVIFDRNKYHESSDVFKFRVE
jgi:hypothetical protein